MSFAAAFWTAVAAFATALGVSVFVLAVTPPVPAATLGLRGLKRSRARRRRAFRAAEPAIRLIGAWISRLPIDRTRAALERLLARAGDYLGLSGDEFLALCAVCGAGGWLLGLAVESALLVELPIALLSASVGVMAPLFSAAEERHKRRAAIRNNLPSVVEIVALCMAAGMDFLGALYRVLGSSAQDDALTDELRLICRTVELGHTRRYALEQFYRRVETDEARDFASAVIQAEERGNPLADVLRVQADVLRTRRSIRAEEAASRASVMMMVPLLFMLGSALVLILSPVLLEALSELSGL